MKKAISPDNKTETKKPRQIKEMREYNSLDSAYVENFTDSPLEGKTAALLKAGYAGDNPHQEAWRMHRKLQDKIDTRTNEKKRNLASLAVHQLEKMLKEDADKVGYSNMNAAIKQGLDYSGHKPTDKVEIVEKEQSYEELLEEREELDRLRPKAH
jgi:hypothetical protein